MKKLLAITLVLVLALSSVCVSAVSTEGFKNGDVDRDGKVKIQDANLIQRNLAGFFTFDSEQKTLADYNLDKEVNINDVTEIQMTLARVKPAPTEDAATSESQAASEAAATSESQATSEAAATSEAGATSEAAATSEAQATSEAAAPNPKVDSTVKIYFSNNKSWSNVYFYLYNSATGTPQKEWPGTQITKYTTNNEGEKVYSSDVDTSKFDRIIFNDGTDTKQTVNVAVNKASSGFYISNDSSKKAMLVGTYAYTGADSGTLKELSFDYPMGYKKKVWIWTPADYKATGEKFRTIYMTDGQNIFDEYSGGKKPPYGGWEVTDAVESMMSNGGRGVIIVGIENTDHRDNELTPNIGELNPLLSASDAQSFKDGKGIEFANFVVDTVMPYVQENYNSSKAKCDNAVVGSSSGGIESFFIGMEHNDKFGMIGALSPAFLLFGDSVWNNYLSKFDLTSDDMPKLYLFNGNHKDDSLEQNLKVFCDQMYERLKKANYKNMTYAIEDEFKHNEAYWRIIFPECISYLLDI